MTLPALREQWVYRTTAPWSDGLRRHGVEVRTSRIRITAIRDYTIHYEVIAIDGLDHPRPWRGCESDRGVGSTGTLSVEHAELEQERGALWRAEPGREVPVVSLATWMDRRGQPVYAFGHTYPTVVTTPTRRATTVDAYRDAHDYAQGWVAPGGGRAATVVGVAAQEQEFVGVLSVTG